MTDSLQVAKILKEVMKSGKYILGAKEVAAGVAGSKAIICTNSVPALLAMKIRSEAQKSAIPVISLSVTSAEFARMIGRPYKVSTIALRSLGESELKQLQR